MTTRTCGNGCVQFSVLHLRVAESDRNSNLLRIDLNPALHRVED